MTTDNIWRRRFSRRAGLRAAAAASVGLAGAALIGCGNSETGSSGTATVTPRAAGPAAPTSAPQAPVSERIRGGRFVHTGHAATTDHLDLNQSTHPGVLSWSQYTNDGILRLDESEPGLFKVVPALAESWERSDDTTLVLKFRSGVKFHDVGPVHGRDFTAEDALYSLARMSTDDPRFPRRSWFNSARIEVVDDSTLRIVTPRPSAALESLLASPWTVVIAREQVEADGEQSKNLIGTGPYLPRRLDVGNRVEFVRNENYWDSEAAWIDRVDEVNIPEAAARVAAFRAGEIAYATVAQEAWEDFARQNPDKQHYSFFGVGIGMTGINTRVEPWNDIRARRALAHAVDFPGWNAVLFDGAGQQTGPMSPAYRLWALEEDQLLYRKQDLQTAKQLASAAGIDNLTVSTITLGSAFYSGQAVNMKEDLANIGINLNVEVVTTPDYTRRLFSQHDFVLSNGQDFSADDPSQLGDRYRSDSGSNLSGYKNAELDGWFDDLTEELNFDARREISGRIQQRIMEDVPSLYTLVYQQHRFVQPDVRDVRFSPMNGNAERWNARYAWLKA